MPVAPLAQVHIAVDARPTLTALCGFVWAGYYGDRVDGARLTTKLYAMSPRLRLAPEEELCSACVLLCMECT
jgi:hypothetical protein